MVFESLNDRLMFISGLLNQGGYLNAAERPLLLPILDSQDVTFFAPNTASALSKFTSFTTNASKSEKGEIFKYHAIPNFLGYSSELKNGMVLKTVQGSNVTITVQGNDTYVNQANIIKTDFLVANGVMHTIDRCVYILCSSCWYYTDMNHKPPRPK